MNIIAISDGEDSSGTIVLNQLIPYLNHYVNLCQHSPDEKHLDECDLIYFHYGGLLAEWNPKLIELIYTYPVIAGLRGDKNLRNWRTRNGVQPWIHKLKAISCANKDLERKIKKHCKVPTFITPSGVDTEMFQYSNPPNQYSIGWAGTKTGAKMFDRFNELPFPRTVATNLPYSEMPAFYKAVSVYICVSVNEGSPVTIREALASGRPVLSTRVGDVEDYLPESWVFNDYRKMIPRIKTWQRNRIRLRNAGRVAREISLNLTYEESAKSYNHMFASI